MAAIARHPAARPRRRAVAAPAALAALLLLAVLPLGGCGDSATTPHLTPLVSQLAGVQQATVLWTTDQATRGSVRWGLTSGAYDHLSYPSAAAGADRQLRQDHAVPLLEAPAGLPIYLRRLDRTRDGFLHAAPEETIVVAQPAGRPPRLELTTLDVQFGDAHVLRLPSRGDLVALDAGPWYEDVAGEPAAVHVRRWLEDRAVDSLAVALATHIHADHYGGFLSDRGEVGLLERFAVGMFLDVPAVTGNASAWQRLQGAVDERGIPRLVIEPGMTDASAPDRLRWDERVAVAVLNAGAQPEWSSMNINNDSVVLRITYGDVDLLTGGDAEKPAEDRMLSRYPELVAGIEWFKAFHHGREDENTQGFLQVVRPRVCTIPVAFSAYSDGWESGLRASDGTLARLQQVGADVFRFDDAAPVQRPRSPGVYWHTTFLTDGASYEIRIEPSIWGL